MGSGGGGGGADTRTCANCGKSPASKSCSRCKNTARGKTYYRSGACQRSLPWPTHRRRCGRPVVQTFEIVRGQRDAPRTSTSPAKP